MSYNHSQRAIRLVIMVIVKLTILGEYNAILQFYHSTYKNSATLNFYLTHIYDHYINFFRFIFCYNEGPG